VSLILVIVIQFNSCFKKPPVYHSLFAYLGSSFRWLYLFAANEVVNALTAIGFGLKLSDMILGMTVLAWGNSLGGKFEWLMKSFLMSFNLK